MEEKDTNRGKRYVLPVVFACIALIVVFAVAMVNSVISKKMAARQPLPLPPGAAPKGLVETAQQPSTAEAPAASTAKAEDDFYRLGEECYYKGDFDSAIANFKKAVELNPNFADAYCEMGVSYMEKKDWGAAVAQLKKSVELNPGHPKAQYALAVSYARMPKPDVVKAREHFEISKRLGFLYPEWFENFLKRLEAGERFPGQEGYTKKE